MFSHATLADRRSDLLRDIRLLSANGYSIFLNGPNVRAHQIEQYRVEIAEIEAILRRPAPVP